VGRDSSGNSTGEEGSLASVNVQVTNGHYLYIGKEGRGGVACSQNVGEAVGCELQVYDISDPTDPVYVAGRDTDGSATGINGVGSIRTLAIKDDYLFVGKTPNGATCSQTAGSAGGCELMVFDISSSTNPVYVAGRDASGSAAGATSFVINNLVIYGDYLFVGKTGNNTACSQTAGSAQGCELMVFDISSSTNPVYVAGRDINGTATGVNSGAYMRLTTSGNYLYAGTGGGSHFCNTEPQGCEIQIYDISNPINPMFVIGVDASGHYGGTYVSNIGGLAISGNYLFVAGSNATKWSCSQTVTGINFCPLSVYDISSSTNPVYVAGRDTGGGTTGDYMSDGNFLTISGDHLFLSAYDIQSSDVACSQTVGQARGCELKVYNISDPVNPTYVAGLDADGSEDGLNLSSINSLIFQNNHLFVGKQGNATACSQVVGSALGCELQVYSFATFLNHSTSFTITQEINEELSLPLINPVTFEAIPGLSGGSSFNSTSFSVATNNPTGYTATLHFSTTTALQRVGGVAI